MANEFLITDVVSKSAIDQLEQLNAKFTQTKETYSGLALELAKGVNVPVSNYDELFKKARGFEEISKKLSSTQAELAQIQKDYKNVLKNVNEEIKKAVNESKAQAAANEKNAKAELAAAKAETERLKQQKLLNQEKKKLAITTEQAIALTNREVHSINEAKEQNKLLRLAVAQVTDAEDKDNKIRQQLNNQITKNTEYIRFNSDAYTKQKMAIGSYKNEIKAAIVELRNGNNTFKNLGVVAKGFGGILKSEVTGGLKEVGLGVSSMIKGFVGAQAIIAGIQRLIGLFKQGIQAAIDFEAANSKLAAILGTTSNNIKDLTADSKRLGETTKFTASQAAALQIELAKLGFSREEILESTEYILRFAQATGAELPEAAALAGAALRMFNADTSETERYVSAMAVATTKSALSFSYLQTAMPIVGPVAKAFNFQIEDTLALLGKLSDAGFDPSMAATATRNILLNLADGSGKLAKALGGPVKTLPELVAGLQKLKEQGIDLNSTLELTDKRSVAAFNAFLTAADKIVPLREQITGVDKELGDMAEEMGDNVQGALLRLSSAWEGFMITLNGSNGVLRGFIEDMASLVGWMREVVSTAEELGGERIETAKRVGQEAAKLDKEWVKSKQESIDSVSLKYRKEGIDGFEAFEKAREEQLKILERSLSQEEARLQLYANRNKQGVEEYNAALKSFNPLKVFQLGDLKDAANESFKLYEEQISYVEGLKTKIEQIKGLNNEYQVVPEGSFTPTKTEEELEKERRAAEAAAKERLRIQQELEQSKLDLMEEGLQKELDKIAFNYNKRIAAIKGNSEEEEKTRENIAVMMQRALDDKTYSFALEKEKKQINDKLELVKKGSDEEYQLRLQLLDNQREAEINAAIKSGDDVFLIDERYNKKREELQEEHAREMLKKISEEYASRSIIANVELSNEMDDLSKLYMEGIINYEEYEKEKTKITERYGIKQADAALKAAEEMASMPGLSPEDRLKAEEALQKARIALAEKVRDAEIASAEDTEKARKKSYEDMAEAIRYMEGVANDAVDGMGDVFGGLANIFNKLAHDGKLSFEDLAKAAAQVVSGITSMMSGMYDARIESLEKEQEANEEAYDKEVERIEKLEENGAISKEEAEARKRAAEDKTKRKDEEIAKRKEQLQLKQAKWEKANSIIQAGIATALAITQALPDLILAALVGAMGAAQVAVIAAQPIPKYAKGTKDHPGGLAIVGDGGKKEGILTESGMFISPDKPTLVDLPVHAQVIPDLSFIYDRRGIQSDYALLEKQLKEQRDNGIVVNVNSDYTRLERKMESNTKELQNISRMLREANKIADYNYISRRL